MKWITRLLLPALFVFSQKADAQCIKDIQNLIDMPEPCYFIGMIDFDNLACFDLSSELQFKYTWKIRSADDGELIATYDGMVFGHRFEKFGGYEFCLEVDKDLDPTNAPDIVDCVTYTTCQVCTPSEIHIDYVTCPYGSGCEVNISTKIPSQNAVGLKPTAKIIATYLPTPQELAGGVVPFDLEFDEIDVEHNNQTDSILVSQNISVPYKRGCFLPRIQFKFLDGYGAHGLDWMPCTDLQLLTEEKFRCIACANEDGDCVASVLASEISNTDGTCNLFTLCSQLREDANDENHDQKKKELTISPNPASDRLHVDLPKYECDSRKLVIFNNIGQQVVKIDLPLGEMHADVYVNHLSEGLYLVAVLEYGEIAHSAQVVISKS